MLKAFSVHGLNKQPDINLQFHGDLNIVTGRNGCGKTTLLKLLWFMMSGNVERISPEIEFQTAKLETDTFSLSLEQNDQEGTKVLKWVFTPVGGDEVKGTSGPAALSTRLERLNKQVISRSGKSLFFPTFRRIEGGFSMARPSRIMRESGELVYVEPSYDVEGVLHRMAQGLTVRNHRFIASISTADIVQMLTSQYANVSEQINEDHQALAKDVILAITNHEQAKSTEDRLEKAQGTLELVKQQITQHTQEQARLLSPFTELNKLISTIFQHKGIRVTSRVTLGDAAEAIASDKLSAGEKQMLSFLVYNAFDRNSVIFIDEPEISLHVDWQRRLFPTLLAQGSTNQFIIATHSPFIYTPFRDKELLIDTDRGE